MFNCMKVPISQKKNPLSALELITDFFFGRLSQAIINPMSGSGQ